MPIFIRCLDGLKKSVQKTCPHFYRKLLKRRALVKYLVAGAFTSVLDLFSLFVLHGWLKIEVVIATTAAYLMSLGLSFYIQRVWTFNNNDNETVADQAGLYFLTVFINLTINGSAMHLFVSRWHIQYMLAQILVGIFLAGESFIMYRFVVFHKPAPRTVSGPAGNSEEK